MDSETVNRLISTLSSKKWKEARLLLRTLCGQLFVYQDSDKGKGRVKRTTSAIQIMPEHRARALLTEAFSVAFFSTPSPPPAVLHLCFNILNRITPRPYCWVGTVAHIPPAAQPFAILSLTISTSTTFSDDKAVVAISSSTSPQIQKYLEFFSSVMKANFQKDDKNVLFGCIPISLKHSLLPAMSQIIRYHRQDLIPFMPALFDLLSSIIQSYTPNTLSNPLFSDNELIIQQAISISNILIEYLYSYYFSVPETFSKIEQTEEYRSFKASYLKFFESLVSEAKVGGRDALYFSNQSIILINSAVRSVKQLYRMGKHDFIEPVLKDLLFIFANSATEERKYLFLEVISLLILIHINIDIIKTHNINLLSEFCKFLNKLSDRTLKDFQFAMVFFLFIQENIDELAQIDFASTCSPFILRLGSLHESAFVDDLCSLLHRLITPKTLLFTLHTILDLPFFNCCVQLNTEKQSNRIKEMTKFFSVTMSSPSFSIENENETVSISEKRNIRKSFLITHLDNECFIGAKLKNFDEDLVPSLLTAYFEFIEQILNEKHKDFDRSNITSLLSDVVFDLILRQNNNYLFFDNHFCVKVNTLSADFLLKAFNYCPEIIIELERPLCDTFTTFPLIAGTEHSVLAIVSSIGNAVFNGHMPIGITRNFETAIELMVYQSLSIFSLVPNRVLKSEEQLKSLSQNQFNQQKKELILNRHLRSELFPTLFTANLDGLIDPFHLFLVPDCGLDIDSAFLYFPERFFVLVSNALAKITVKFGELKERAILCLSKILDSSRSFANSVSHMTNYSISVLERSEISERLFLAHQNIPFYNVALFAQTSGYVLSSSKQNDDFSDIAPITRK